MRHWVQLWREKKTNMYFRNLFLSFESIMNFKKENTKFSELSHFHCINWPLWSEKNCNYWSYYQYMRTGKSIDSKVVRVGPHICKLCLFEPTCVSLASHLYYHFQVCQMCYQTNPLNSMSFWTMLHLNGLETILLIHLEKNQRLIVLMSPSKSFHFILNYLVLVYFTFIYFITYWTTFMTQFRRYIELVKWCTTFNYLLSIKVTILWISVIY